MSPAPLERSGLVANTYLGGIGMTDDNRSVAPQGETGDVLRCSQIGLRLPSDLVDRLNEAAEEHGLSLTRLCRALLDEGLEHLLPPEEVRFTDRNSNGATASRQSSKLPISDGLLREVASLYREAMLEGVPPRQYIADRVTHGPVARSTVANWIGHARKRTDPETGRSFLGSAKGTRSGEMPEVAS